MVGRRCRIEPLNGAAHVAALADAFTTPEALAHDLFRYTSKGPFEDVAACRAWLDGFSRAWDKEASQVSGQEFLGHVIIDAASGRALGMASYGRVRPAHGSFEVGLIVYAPPLKRTRAATEAMYLMMARAFDELGCRRYEWKCDALNGASNRAAQRLGFTYEGTFRQDMVIKGRSRDTSWYSILDREWPAIKAGLEAWLEDANFDSNGRQRRGLAELMLPRC